METFLYIQINLFPIITLFVLLCNSFSLFKKISNASCFRLLIIFTIVILVTDSFCWYLKGNPKIWVSNLLSITLSLYFMLSGLISYMWLIYVYRQLTQHSFLKYKWMILWVIPELVLVILASSASWNKQLFSISSDNNYIRGPLFHVQTIVCVVYIAAAAIYAIYCAAKAKTTSKMKEAIVLVSFVFFPLFGAGLQIAFYGLAVTWPCVAMAILLVYINLRNFQASIDPLTGLLNRNQFDTYITAKCHHADLSRRIYVLLMDVNSFKQINDKFGHNIGDDALILVAHTLKKIFEIPNAILCRYGGDEFCAVMTGTTEKQVNIIINKIDKAFENLQTIYPLSISTGYAVYGTTRTCSIEQMIAVADKMMYSRKNKYKEHKNQLKKAEIS